MANKKWSDVYTSNPSTKIQATDIVNLGRTGSPTAGIWGTLSQYANIIYITNNGDDTHGNGSLLSPYATGPAVEAFISASSPSATNNFLILDLRTGVINEAVKFIPFVSRIGNGLAELNGNWTMSSLFSSITSDTFPMISNYKSVGATTPGTAVFDFSALSTTHAIHITLQNFQKALYTGTYKGNDSANFNTETFRINEYNFNTAFINPDNSVSRSNITLSSGIKRHLRNCEYWQLSSVTKSLGSVPCITNLDVRFCGLGFFQTSTGTLAVINSGGANNQPMTKISCLTCLSGNSILVLDITNDGSSTVDFFTDVTTGYSINSSNSLTNITFTNNSPVDHQNTTFVPANYTPSSYDDDGFTVTTNLLGAHLNGIDTKLGTIGPGSSSYPPNYIRGFQLTWNSVGPPATMSVGTGFCRDSANSFDMSLASPVTLDTTSASIDNGGTWTDASWYAIWLYQNSTTNATTVKFSLSFSSPATISGFNKIRLVGSVKAQTTGTNILAFVHTGLSNDRTYAWINGDGALGVLIGGGATSITNINCAGAMSPIASEINLQLSFAAGVTGDKCNVAYPGVAGAPLVFISGFDSVSFPIIADIVTGYLPVNSSQQLAYFNSGAGGSLNLTSTGYRESL